MGDYQHLNHPTDQERVMNGFANHVETTAEDVPVLKAERRADSAALPPMSQVRKFLFVSSLIMCVLTVVIFLWVLPCDCGICRKPSVYKSSIRSWEILLKDIELKGSINLVSGVPSKGGNLLFMLRNDSVNPKYFKLNSSKLPSNGGIIAIFGSDGTISWLKEFFAIPTDMSCVQMDVNKDGIEDCIVVGNKGLMAALDPSTASVYWFLHDHNPNSTFECTGNVEFPVILPDLNGDGVFELLTTCEGKNWMFVVSGRGGNVLGQLLTYEDCMFIWNLNMSTNWSILYTCHTKNGRDHRRQLTLQVLVRDTLNQSFESDIYPKLFPRTQHHTYKTEALKKTRERSMLFNVGNKYLAIENRGRCPYECVVSINVTDKRRGNEKILLYNYTAESAYAMIPVSLIFTNKASTSAEPVGGFVIKLWQWISTSRSEDINSTNDNPRFCSYFKRSKRLPRTSVPLMDIISNTTSKLYNKVHMLSERVILITFNATDVHIINASQSEIIQVCVYRDEDEIDCQPNLKYQDQSLYICDLDQDGSQELVTYLTTYVVECDNEQQYYKLQSRVRVIRLEAEVPKLYEAMTKIS